MLKNTQNKKQNKKKASELFKNIFKNIKPSQSRCLCGLPGFSPAASRGADGRSEAYKTKKEVQKKGWKKYAPNNQKRAQKKKCTTNTEKKTEKEEKRCTTNTKKYEERAWPCGRAASGRVAWREALKKYAPKTDSFHCCRW